MDSQSKGMFPIVFWLCSAVLVAPIGGCQWLWTEEAPTEDGEIAAPADPRQPSEEQAQRISRAQQEKEAGNYAAAVALFREILAENPTITTAYLGLGDIYMELEDYGKAEPNYGRAARLEPRNFDAQIGHGMALQMLRRFVEAVRAYHRALVLRPDDPQANLNMATTYLEMGEAQSAERFAEKAVEADPENGHAWLNLGVVYDELGKYPNAIEAYRAAMELIEPTEALQMNLVGALAKDNRYRETINAAETLNRMKPNANAFERMGWAHFKLREYDESAAAYRKAVELDAGHWVSWNGIGINALNRWLLSKKRDDTARQEAGEALRRSLRINPDQERVLQVVSTYRL